MKIYTDGAYSMSRNRGGYAFIVCEDGKFTKKYYKSITDSTNQRAEIMAVISAFRYIVKQNIERAEIITDSMYVVGTSTLGWKIGSNQDLWFVYFHYYNKIKDRVTFTHVRGHQGNEGNELADLFSVIASTSIDL